MTDTISNTLQQQTAFLPDPWGWAAIAGGAVLIALAIHWVVFRLLRRLSHHSDSKADNIVVDQLLHPTRAALVGLALVLVAREVPAFDAVWAKIASFAMPALIGWVAIAILHALIEAMKLRADITVADNLAARRRRTRLAMVNRIATFVIVFVTVGLMLLSIPGVRDIGVTLVASAGLAGLAVGAAAQPALKKHNGGRLFPTENATNDSLLLEEIKSKTGLIYHPVGTCKMGPDSDSQAVVDASLKVRGLENLRVIDASIMPTVISGNTNAPTIAIAEKGADLIKADA